MTPLHTLATGWTKGTFVAFHDLGQLPKGITKLFAVLTLGNAPLGEVKYFPRWRKYSFFPKPETVFEETCLREIADFCALVTKQHREARKRERAA